MNSGAHTIISGYSVAVGRPSDVTRRSVGGNTGPVLTQNGSHTSNDAIVRGDHVALDNSGKQHVYCRLDTLGKGALSISLNYNVTDAGRIDNGAVQNQVQRGIFRSYSNIRGGGMSIQEFSVLK